MLPPISFSFILISLIILVKNKDWGSPSLYNSIHLSWFKIFSLHPLIKHLQSVYVRQCERQFQRHVKRQLCSFVYHLPALRHRHTHSVRIQSTNCRHVGRPRKRWGIGRPPSIKSFWGFSAEVTVLLGCDAASHARKRKASTRMKTEENWLA
jgi:hypothetical protein